MRRSRGQLSLADGLAEGGAGRNRQLERIAVLVDGGHSSDCWATSTRRRRGAFPCQFLTSGAFGLAGAAAWAS